MAAISGFEPYPGHAAPDKSGHEASVVRTVGETTTNSSWWCEPPEEFQALGEWIIRTVTSLDALLPRSTVWPFDDIAQLTDCLNGSAKHDVECTAEDFFAERKGRGDKDAAILFLRRSGGEAPQVGDELPE